MTRSDRVTLPPSVSLRGGIHLLHGDCLAILPTLADNSVDSIVTDPPYGLAFMGQRWDYDVPSVEVWVECLRVLKPGGHMVAFGGTRTYHRMVCAIEDGGFEIRDQLAWVYGSGFPKSRNLDGAWAGWGTALKPAWEPIVLARKPIVGTVAANVLEHGTGALNIDGCRVETKDVLQLGKTGLASDKFFTRGVVSEIAKSQHPQGRWPANLLHDGSDEVLAAFPEAPGQLVDQSSSSRKNQTVYGAMKRGNGRDGETSADSNNEGAVGFKMKPEARRGDAGSAARFFYCAKADRADRNAGLHGMPERDLNWSSGTQSPGTFQSPNTNRAAQNHHPTVKPTDLMRWLCRLITPPGGTVLDPFMGSGSTLKAAELERFSAIGIELDPDYIEIARRRIAADAPLFADVA